MVKSTGALFLGLALFLTGCTTYTMGSSHDSDPNGSYSGSTLNSPVTDQNPHAGGSTSYPSSMPDVGVTPPPPDKVDGR